jgi:hypothetical protein
MTVRRPVQFRQTFSLKNLRTAARLGKGSWLKTSGFGGCHAAI